MDIEQYFNSKKWTFAKTYAEKAPHEYIVRRGQDSKFEQAVIFIRENGFKAKFWNKEFTYLLVDGKLYWTMGAPVEDTIIINRCSLDDYEISEELVVRRKEKNNGSNV